MKHERLLVVSAHALDFLWRCGGTIAKYANAGAQVLVIDLTDGVRGESNALWKKNPQTTEKEILAIRREEAKNATEILGAQIQFFGWSDHMLQGGQERVLQLARAMMDFKPTIVLTHFTSDPMNPDHPVAANLVIDAYRCAHTSGVFPGVSPCSGVKLYMFEPAYPEVDGYAPDMYIDITNEMPKKMQAMQAGSAQNVLAEAYDKRNGYRGHLASKLSGNKNIRYAETFLRFKPYVGDTFC